MFYLSTLKLSSKKLLLLLVMGLVLTLGSVSLARAADAPLDVNVKMTVRALFDGNFKYGDWLPVEVSLENYGSATDVRVESSVISSYNGANYNTLFQRYITLGARSNKRFIFYIQPFVATNNVSRFVTYEQSIFLRVSDKTIIEQKVKLSPVSPTDYLVGVFASDISQLGTMWNNLKVGPLRSRVTPVAMNAAELPDRVEGLRSFDALVFSEFNTANLSRNQLTAIKNWVAEGGQLVLMGGTGWNRVQSGFDSSFSPLDVFDFATINDISSLIVPFDNAAPLTTPANMAVGQVLNGAEPVIISSVNSSKRAGAPIPLVAERLVGSGRVVATAVDFMVSPTNEWAGISKAWQNIFSFNAGAYYSIYSEANPHLKNNPEILAMLTSVAGLPLPDIVPYLILFASYLLLVAPLSYIVLRRIRKTTWAWSSIPLITLLFTGGAIWMATQNTPGEVLVNQFSVVQSAPGMDMAYLRSYAAVFSPEEKRYDVIPQLNENALSPLVQPLNRAVSRNPNDSQRTAVQGDNARVYDFEIGEWGAQGFSFESTTPARLYSLQATLSFKDNKIVGTIRNTTNFSIKGVLLVLGDTIQKVKDLEPGETLNVDFPLPAASQFSPALCSTSYSSYGSTSSFETTGDKLRRVLQGTNRDDKNLTNQALFLKKMYDIGRYGPAIQKRGFDLIGWINTNPAPLAIPGAKVTIKSNQALITRLPITMQSADSDNQFYLPPAFLYPEIVRDESGVAALSTSYDRNDQVCVGVRGNVTAMYRLPVEQGPVRPKSMTLYFNSFTANNSRTPASPEQIEFYDWQQAKWIAPIKGASNSAVSGSSTANNIGTSQPNVIDQPARFVNSQTGQILVRFSSGNAALFIQFSLALEGTR